MASTPGMPRMGWLLRLVHLDPETQILQEIRQDVPDETRKLEGRQAAGAEDRVDLVQIGNLDIHQPRPRRLEFGHTTPTPPKAARPSATAHAYATFLLALTPPWSLA